MTLLIFYVLLALGFSFLCSIMEAVLLSATPSYLAERSASGSRGARRLRRHKEDIDRPLSAILSLNTIAHTGGAAGAGAQAVKVFGDAYMFVISAVLTLLILFLSEIIPKTLGAVYWRRLVPVVEPLLSLTIWSMLPLVWLSQGLTRLIARRRDSSSVSRAEVAALAELGMKEGVFQEREMQLLKAILGFESLTAADVMTPRVVMVSLPGAATVAETAPRYGQELNFSRIPLYEREREDIIGVVHRHDVLAAAASGRGAETLRSLKRPLLSVPETLALPALFDMLRQRTEHIALVVDEYGGVSGLVTMEDVIETLIGLEIMDEVDAIEDMQAFARDRWRARASALGLPIEELALEPEPPPNGSRDD